MLSLSFIFVQSILFFLDTALAVPIHAESPSLSLISDPTTTLILPLNDSVTVVPGNTTKLAAWPLQPFTIPLTAAPSTWLWVQDIGFPGSREQKTILLDILTSQLVIYTSQPPGISPHPFKNTRHDVTFAMRYEEGEKLDMDLALSGLRVFRRKVQQWGAQDLGFSLGRDGKVLAKLNVELG